MYWTLERVHRGTIGRAQVYLDDAALPDSEQGQYYVKASGVSGPLAEQCLFDELTLAKADGTVGQPVVAGKSASRLVCGSPASMAATRG